MLPTSVVGALLFDQPLRLLGINPGLFDFSGFVSASEKVTLSSMFGNAEGSVVFEEPDEVTRLLGGS